MSLLRRRDFGLLWFAGFASLAADWALWVAAPVAVYELTGSAAVTSATVAVSVGARLLFGPVAGVYVDRWDRRRVLLWANVLHAAVVLPALAVTSADRVWILLAVVFGQAVLAQFVSPAEHALLPRLVPADQLAAANALNGLNNNLARLIGPALGGVAAAAFGLPGAIWLNVGSVLTAAALVALIRGRHRAEATAPATIRRDLLEGLRAIVGSAALRALFLALVVLGIGEGVMKALIAVFVNRELHGGTLELGTLMSAQAVGGLAGGLVATWLAGRWRSARMVTVGLVAIGAIDLVIFNYPRWFTALAGEIGLFAVVGIPAAVAMTGAITLLQTEVADAYRGRVFAAATVAQSAAMLIGTAIAATATGPLDVIAVLTVQAAGYLAAGVLFGLLTRHGPGSPPPVPAPDREPARVTVTVGDRRQ